ncbi:MAG: hypothetical protein IKB39_00465 [Bacteroidaceae bacterium]|nr:hypothetical protein [Bacteroidaceae bacterium]
MSTIIGMFRKLLVVLVFVLPIMGYAREDELAGILEKCLQREMVSPDSIEYNLQLLEKERAGKTGVRRAVYTAALAQLYAMRAYSDATGEWRKRSLQLFREALAEPELLYNARTKDWLPIVERGKDEKVYGSNMLYVVWRAAYDWCPQDSVMSEQELIDFYVSYGNSKPAQVKAEKERLWAIRDSILDAAPKLRVYMAEVYYPGDSLNLTIEDSVNVKQVQWRLLDSRGKLLEKNPLVAPTKPGRYIMEFSSKTDVRLWKKPKKVKKNFVVSALQCFVTDMPGKQVRVTAVDARTGKPMPEATVIKGKEKNTVLNTVRVVLGADSCLPEIAYYDSYNYSAPSSREQSRVAIYTDRSIYRPGQKVQMSAILYSMKHWEAQVRQSTECRVQLQEPRTRKVLADTTLRSDDFGSLSATLEIPMDAELGSYWVRVDGTVHEIRVEEYKRPVFYVEMDERDMEVSVLPMEEEEDEAKDSIIYVSGRAMNYDGTPLRGGRVTATARRMTCWWWRRMFADESRHLDTVYTDMEGRFVLAVPVSRAYTYRYAPRVKVDVSVLSAQGETQTDYAFVRLFADPPMVETGKRAKEWLECPVDSFDAQTPARLEFRMPAGKQRYVFLTAFAGESVAIDTVMLMTDTLTCMDIPYKDSYADGIRLMATYVLDGMVRSKNIPLYKRLPDTRLHLHWETFRDFTQPGATEQWTMRVTDAKGQPVDANVMLGMYDASLDAFGANEWKFVLPMNHSLPYTQQWSMGWFYKLGMLCAMNFDVWYPKIPKYEFSAFNQDYFNRKNAVVLFEREFSGGTQRYIKVNSPSAGMAEMEESAQIQEDDIFAGVDVRTDFSETAMFMPRLRTDAEGRVAISFTMPQSLTTWNLNGLAHTRDMRVGTLGEKIVARKALTAKLHLPRFVREQDVLSFTVQVNNTGTAMQKGKVQVQVMDAQTDKVLMKKTVKFAVAQERDTVYTFTYPVAQGLEGLKFKAVALADKDSDGEQREIPVLSSVVTLTESKALTLEPGESEKVILADLFPAGAQDRRVIVEKVADPVQTALEALPKVVQPSANDVLSYASAYYAAHKLGLPDTTIYINKVYTMQKENGSMPWYPGLAGNAYLTREVGYLLARLGSGNANARKVMAGIKRYLKATLEEGIEKRKEYNKDWTPWLGDLRTLYVLVKDGEADKETLQLVKKVLKRLPDNLEEMDSEYIAIAMIVKHALKEAVLKDGVAVLRTRLNHKDGTYLAYRGGSWPSIDRRLHIHTQVMEAWHTVCPEDTATIRGMQYWLLDQKRTQGWKSPIDCIDAVYALTGGMMQKDTDAVFSVQRDTLDISKNKSVVIKNDGKSVMWAAVYGEYALPIGQVESAGMDISLERRFNAKTPQVGDRIKESILIDAKRDYEYVVLSVPRAGCTEPVSKLSGCGWQKGLSFYMQVRDDRTDYFIPALPHGKYVLETELTVERKGAYASGVPAIRCCYAEEFRAHGVNEIVEVRE